MTRFVVTPAAEFDISAILRFLRTEAGSATAEKYRRLFQAAIGRLRTFPNSGAPRPVFGERMRMVVVSPYLLFYDYQSDVDCVTLLRVLHGKIALDERLGPR